MIIITTEAPESVQRMSRDLVRAAATLTDTEARFYVDTYYQWQDERITQAGRIRSTDEPTASLRWLEEQASTIENQVKRALGAYSQASPVGRWAESIVGIGPVLSAGLLANIDITRAPTVGHVWRFAGLDPTVRWERGEKRPWNATLKVLAWKIGESFVKVRNNERDIYGHIYYDRKLYEQAKNEAGDYADQAAAMLERKKFRKDTEAFKAYSAGKLPAGHIDARAKRYAAKLFLSHWHHVAYENHYGEAPPKPYVIAMLGHAHYQGPPNWPMK